jgi:hypothetical protein
LLRPSVRDINYTREQQTQRKHQSFVHHRVLLSARKNVTKFGELQKLAEFPADALGLESEGFNQQDAISSLSITAQEHSD